MIQKLDKIIYRISAVFGSLSFICMVAMVVLNLLDIALTKIALSPIQGAYELTERLLMCTVFASLAYAQMNDGHIHTTLFISHLPRGVKFFVFGLTSAMTSGACILWTYSAWQQIFSSIRTNSVTSVLHIPLYPFYIFEFVLLIVFSIILVWDTVMAFLAIRNDFCAEQISSGWA